MERGEVVGHGQRERGGRLGIGGRHVGAHEEMGARDSQLAEQEHDAVGGGEVALGIHRYPPSSERRVVSV
ncbi:MAG: hypothetical protein ACTHMP_14520 [Thermomicrobiales bacterium]